MASNENGSQGYKVTKHRLLGPALSSVSFILYVVTFFQNLIPVPVLNTLSLTDRFRQTRRTTPRTFCKYIKVNNANNPPVLCPALVFISIYANFFSASL